MNGRVLMRDRKVLTLDRARGARRGARRLAASVRGRRSANERPARSPSRFRRRIAELAAEIERDYPPDEDIHLVGVLKGGFVFMADLVRAMSARVTLDFIAVSSYQQSTQVVGRSPPAQGSSTPARGPPRHHRRGHRRHRPDADLPAGHPARPRAEDAADGMPAQQAVAPAGRREGRVHRLHDRGPVRRSATAWISPRSTGTCRISRSWRSVSQRATPITATRRRSGPMSTG